MEEKEHIKHLEEKLKTVTDKKEEEDTEHLIELAKDRLNTLEYPDYDL